MNTNYWDNLVPIELNTASTNSAFFLAYQAAQVKAGDKGFLSRDITVTDLLMNRSDMHHVFPKQYLKQQGKGRNAYNQITNFVIAQSEINIAIGDKAPEKYFAELVAQCDGGKLKYGGITSLASLKTNLRAHCLPAALLDGEVPDYDTFLAERRLLMAKKIRDWFEAL
jgi:hypothetical protein